MLFIDSYSHLLKQLNTFTHLYRSSDLSYSSKNCWTSLLVFYNYFFVLATLFTFLPVQLPGYQLANLRTSRQTSGCCFPILLFSFAIPTLDCTVGPQPTFLYIPHLDGTFWFSTHRSTMQLRNKVNFSLWVTFLSSQGDLLQLYR